MRTFEYKVLTTARKWLGISLVVNQWYDENDQPVAIKEYLPSQLALRKEGDALPSISEENLATFRYGMRCFF